MEQTESAPNEALEGSQAELEQTYDNYDRFRFHIEDLIDFIFPANLQHPLAAARLIAFGLYGPLDREGRLRSGIQGQHVLAEYELQAMCIQIEREDIVKIYLHRARDMGMLNTAEQDMIINQADAHLKREKGKAMLPRITKEDVRQILKHLSRDEIGRISFHDAQKTIDKYRYDRVKRYKLVFPNLTQKADEGEETSNNNNNNSSGKGAVEGGTYTHMAMTHTANKSLRSTRRSSHRGLGKTVSSSVAPVTMFQKMKGLGNADLTEQTTKYIGKHGFKIVDLDQPSTVAMTSNVKLLRDIPPSFTNPYKGKREEWNDTSNMSKVGLGSMVQGTQGSTTWRRKYTSY